MIEKKDLRYTFRYSERLHLQKDFDRVLRKGRKLVSPAIFVYFISRNDGSDSRRLGLVTSSKVGNAVQRNRLKRRLREIFRLNKHKLIFGIDIVFILRKAAASMDYYELEKIVFSLLQRANILL